MSRLHLIIGLKVHALADWTHAAQVIGRALIGLLAFLMVAMLWTERFFTWDKFLQGGQDLELSLVALVVFLCLILLLAQRSRQAVTLHLAIAQLLAAGPNSARRSILAKLLQVCLSLSRSTSVSLDMPIERSAGICLSPLRI